MAISSSRISRKLSLSSNSRQLFNWSRVRTLRESSTTVSWRSLTKSTWKHVRKLLLSFRSQKSWTIRSSFDETLFSLSIMSGTRFLIFKRISNVSVIFRFRALRIVRSGNLHIVLCCDNFWFLFVNRHVNRVYSMPTTTRRCD